MGRFVSGVVGLAFAALAAAATAAPLTVPFDYSRAALGLDVTVKGTPLYMILDTGVDPSVIDIARAEALRLPIQRAAGGEASGEGDAKTAQAYPATITGLSIAGRDFSAVDARATDMGALSARYGRPLDGVLGYSFLADKIVLIDYPRSTVSLLDAPSDAWPMLRGCHTHYVLPLRSYDGDTIPIIADFRLGAARTPISLDTGSNGGIALYQGALALPGVRAALTEKGETGLTGARGDSTSKIYALDAEVGFGPFSLPPGQIVTVRRAPGSADTRLANIGNKLFAAMKLKMLLNYPANTMVFYGDCP